jgi:hypothetical protein
MAGGCGFGATPRPPGQRPRRWPFGAPGALLRRLGVVLPAARGLVGGRVLGGGFTAGLAARGPRKSLRVPSLTTVVRTTTIASPTTIDTGGG